MTITGIFKQMTGFQFHLLVTEVACFTTTEPGRTALGKEKYACFPLLIFFCWSTSSAHCRLTSFLLGRRCINILCDEKCNFRISSTIKHTEGKHKKSFHRRKPNHDQRALLMDLGPVKSWCLCLNSKRDLYMMKLVFS